MPFVCGSVAIRRPGWPLEQESAGGAMLSYPILHSLALLVP